MKTNLDKIFKTVTKDEVEGIWLEVSEKTKFLVKRFGGKNQKDIKIKMAKYYKPWAKLIEKGMLPEEKERDIYNRVFIECSLTDWMGVELDGKALEFNYDNAVLLLGHLPELAETLIAYAMDVANFVEDEVGPEDLGNS